MLFCGGPSISSESSHQRPVRAGRVFRGDGMIDVRKRLQNDLKEIERELRVDLPREILRAREHGDLSENAEYKAAKERQSYLEGRKAQLQKRLAALSLVNLEK